METLTSYNRNLKWQANAAISVLESLPEQLSKSEILSTPGLLEFTKEALKTGFQQLREHGGYEHLLQRIGG